MELEILQGTEQRLYDLVAPLVLNPAVIRQNGGVGFKTSENHVWIVAISDEGLCKGFLPLKIRAYTGEINNYHVHDRDQDLLAFMLEKVLEYAKAKTLDLVDIIAQIPDYQTLEAYGFTAERQFVKYTRYRKRLQ